MEPVYRFTPYSEHEVLRKRPYIDREWCIRVLEHPVKIEQQPDGRYRFWGVVAEYDGRVVRVVTLSDKLTIHNAFPDRGFEL